MRMEKTKNLINQAIKTCEDFRFEKIKRHLLLALKETDRINEKQNKKLVNKEEKEKTKSNNILNRNELDNIISKIDNLIEKEHSKNNANGREDGVILD